ncbi:hypothetical protein OVA26_04070 [Microbacterium sp. SL62]|uniref:hypothetical protein n=1 Tax=Microbacterium sp. SL62 TaxID=2995139 RepID=UPI002273B585|nr:hypothetical protein [Microbacterium sp. SL62]MCY1716124.1 hypothetical protein [Microbacterium sp. SL62]
MALDIGVDSEYVRSHVSNITHHNDALPTERVVANIDGNSTEPAASEFTDHLRQRAEALGARIELVRQYVAANAAALAQAVVALEEQDQMSATDARQAASLIDSASVAPQPGTAAGGFAGGQAGARGVLGLQ